LGVLGGLAADRVFAPGDYVDGLLVGVIFYLASYYVARYLWFKETAREHLGKIYSTGVGGYVLTFLFTWILLFTLIPA
jgi:hypothetical protein